MNNAVSLNSYSSGDAGITRKEEYSRGYKDNYGNLKPVLQILNFSNIVVSNLKYFLTRFFQIA